MKIRELARVSGTPRSTIHHYRNVGLLPPPRTLGPKLHVYSPEHVERLCEIKKLRQSGLSLQAIRERPASVESKRVNPRRPRGPTRSDGSVDEAQRSTILDVAARRFVDRGFDGVSIEQVARAAGVGKATLYRHFGSKTELFVECLERLRFSVITPEERAVVDSGLSMPEEALLRATAVLARFESFRMMTNLLSVTAHGPEPGVAARARQALHRMVTNAEPMLKRAMAAGQMRETDSELLAYMLWGALIAVGDRLALDGKYGLDEAVRAYLDFVTNGTTAA